MMGLRCLIADYRRRREQWSELLRESAASGTWSIALRRERDRRQWFASLPVLTLGLQMMRELFLNSLFRGRKCRMDSHQHRKRMCAEFDERREIIADFSLCTAHVYQILCDAAFFGREVVVLRHLIEIRYQLLNN